jgi:succinate dehydrogenase / fumarate reductase, iron-sulfur subunit
MKKSENMSFNLLIWRQKSPEATGKMVEYTVRNISPDISFLEMLDVLNEDLVAQKQEPIHFDSDCREGICGACGLMIDGLPNGNRPNTSACQLYMRHFQDGQTISLEPFRAKAFPIIKDLVVDRSALDRIMSQGGYISVNTGNAPDGNAIPIPKELADQVMDVAQCIGCGACVAACPNASASLFVAAKISHHSLLPQGTPERKQRVQNMVDRMDAEGFGNCSNHWECQAACPKGISVSTIGTMRKEYFRTVLL